MEQISMAGGLGARLMRLIF